mmetsp:Transcript_132444/g.264272  ORF Transcript_132444/g.264272 Transcript_132444/m.264272 type:complete len:378 (-) Transcript_132444:208-1341(-)
MQNEKQCSGCIPENMGSSTATTARTWQTEREQTPLLAKKAPAAVRALSGLLVAGSYITISAAMILFNKALMREDWFPFPVMLAFMHMLSSLTMCLTIRRFAPWFFPSAPMVFNEPLLLDALDERRAWNFLRVVRALVPFVPIAACGALCLVTGNWAYRVATVSFLQMIKETHVVVVYAISLILGLEQAKASNAMILIFVAVSASLAVSNQASMSVSGLALQMVAGFFGSLQIVLTSIMLSRSGKGKIDPMTMVLCVAPLMLVILLPACIITWDHMIFTRLFQFWRSISCNVVLAFVLQVSIALTIRNLSSVGMSLASVTKDLGIVFAASHLLGDHLSWVQLLGFGGSVVGISFYSAMKIWPEAVDDPAMQPRSKTQC